MASTSQVSSPNSGKDLVNKDGRVTELIEWATEKDLTPEQILDRFAEAGIPVSTGEELTGDYHVVHAEEKPEWCAKHVGTRLMVVQWHFYEGDTNEFAAMHIVSAFGKYIVNDSAQGGMYGQLRGITDIREKQDPKAASTRTSTVGLMVAGGLRGNRTFQYSKTTKRAIPKADQANYEKYPAEDRADSKPTWSFDL